MKLVSKVGETTFTYTVDTDDVLFLLRAVEREGPKQSHVACTLINYFMAFGAHGELGTVTRISEVITSYAQPVNPAWFENGPKFLSRLADAKSPEEVQQLKLQARERPAFYTAQKFSASTKEAVYAAFKGCEAIAEFPYVTEYANASAEAQAKKEGKVVAYRPPSGKIENLLWWWPAKVPSKEAYRGYTNPEPEKVEQEMTAWGFDSSSGDVRTALGLLHTYYLNQRQANENKTAYITRVRALDSNAVPVTSYINDVTGTGSPSLAQKALQSFLVGQRRALAMAGSSRKAFYESAGKDVAAKLEVFTAKTANLVKESEAVLSLPVVVNAIGFDPATGEWVRRTNTTTIVTSTAPQPAVPPTSSP